MEYSAGVLTNNPALSSSQTPYNEKVDQIDQMPIIGLKMDIITVYLASKLREYFQWFHKKDCSVNIVKKFGVCRYSANVYMSNYFAQIIHENRSTINDILILCYYNSFDDVCKPMVSMNGSQFVKMY